MSGLPLSVVVASVNGLPYLARCLDSLLDGNAHPEVIVADWTDAETRARVRERWPSVRLMGFEEPTAVPELRAAGIFSARGSYVAVLEDHCVAPAGWAERVVASHDAGRQVVGGPIRNGATRRLRDWAAFFCEYSEHMEPVRDGPTRSLVGMNVSYDRAAVEAMADLLREGRWETFLHPRLLDSGIGLWSDSGLVVDHVKDFGFREFASQRFHYSRSHAGMRNAELGSRRVLHALAWPAVVPLMYVRIARNVFAKRRHRLELVQATPLLLAYLVVWAAGEAVGFAFGGGRSILRVR